MLHKSILIIELKKKSNLHTSINVKFDDSPCCTHRTIMALWRTRTLTPEQKEQIAKVQEDQEERSIMLEDAGPILDAEDASRVDAGSSLDAEDANISKFYNAELPVNVSGLFSHSHLHIFIKHSRWSSSNIYSCFEPKY